MYFKDLELCDYDTEHLDSASWAVPLRAVGWLEHPHAFTTGEVPAKLAGRLAELVDQTNEHFPHYQFRGVHECSLCEAAGTTPPGVGWSQENLIVPGDHEVYVAPGGIVHYVSDHSYCPPSTFIAAAMDCPDCGSAAYFEALRRANAGFEPPMQSWASVEEESRAMAQAALKRRDPTK